MVIIPQRDDVVPPRVQRDLAERLQDPTVIELEGARHDAVISQPEVYIKAIDAFLEN